MSRTCTLRIFDLMTSIDKHLCFTLFHFFGMVEKNYFTSTVEGCVNFELIFAFEIVFRIFHFHDFYSEIITKKCFIMKYS